MLCSRIFNGVLIQSVPYGRHWLTTWWVALSAADHYVGGEEGEMCIGYTRVSDSTPIDTQCQYLAVDSVGGRTKVEVRGVQKPGAAVGSGSPNALLGADTPRESM